jgi:oxygen-independent coproporphyrinogen-3 oxidase
MKAMTQGNAVQESQEVSPEALPFEFMMNAMRLCEGIPSDLYEARTGVPLLPIIPILDKVEALGLITRDWQRIRPTLRGQLFLNELLQYFLPEGP